MAHAAARTASTLRDLGLFAARIVLGTIFIAHGWQKLTAWTIAGTTEAFAGMGVPMPQISAPFVAGLELIGGALLILGAATPLVGLLLAGNMLVAALIAHLGSGVFVDGGGWELVGALGAGSLALAAVGAGRLSLDHAILGRRSTARHSRAASASAAGSAAASAA